MKETYTTKLTFDQAHKKLMSTPWKIKVCNSGERCWCRMIIPVEKIIYNEIEEIYVIGDGSVDKATAEYIVELHNQKIINTEVHESN